MKILDKVEKSKSFWSLLSISFLFFLLRFPSLFEPDWYGDEGVYQTVALALRNGRLLYSQIWDNKPPLLYLIYAALNSDQFSLRLLSLIFGFLSIILFYKLASKLFKNSRTSVILTFVFALLYGLPLFEGNIANAENFMSLPTLISANLILNLKETSQKKLLKIFLAGLLLSVSFLIKTVAVFDLAAFLIFLMFFKDNKFFSLLKNRTYLAYEVKKIILFLSGFSIPIIITVFFFIFKGALSSFLSATLFSNVGYVGYGNKLLIGNISIPQGLLLLKLTILFCFIAFLFLQRKRISVFTSFILIWFSFSLFNALFSQRPYIHYLLVLLPSLVLLLGIIFENIKYRVLFFALFLFSLILISKTFGTYDKTISYYINFIDFIGGKKTVANYQKFFDKETPTNYEIAAFIKGSTSANDNIFIWGNNAQVYNLTLKLPPGRYTVAYHITGVKNGLSETQKSLFDKKPKIIIIMPYMNSYPFSLNNYSFRINLNGTLIYERIL